MEKRQRMIENDEGMKKKEDGDETTKEGRKEGDGKMEMMKENWRRGRKE